MSHVCTDMRFAAEQQIVIVLDVGGVLFRTTQATLASIGSSYFARLISHDWLEGCDMVNEDSSHSNTSTGGGSSSNGGGGMGRDECKGRERKQERVLFIDRNPALFPHVLSYLRCLKTYIPEALPTAELLQVRACLRVHASYARPARPGYLLLLLN